ncbi:MAG: glucose-1-phosphate adenylyltransferase subunit GlgD [Oscillospiraceae bacterium]|jgi:glucose-1-phosphate adenylyltransferase|nr:glucose-1-phosphate adenylyltransferase subunit GlgD [Oscillospiraceae bacterium]
MRAINVLGILYSNAYDEALPEITGFRTMGSVPFGGRYRLIDFPLSSMVACGITKVGVVTKANYRSLMDHLGVGKPWDLARKHESLVILPPYVGAGASGNQTRLEGLCSAGEFLRNSREEYVVMSDCNVVCNLDYRALLDRHFRSGADITVVCQQGPAPKLNTLRLQLGEKSRITGMRLGSVPAEEDLYSLNIFVLRKALLERLIAQSETDDSDYGFFRRNVESLRICAAPVEDYARVIDGLQSYYDTSMDLLVAKNRAALFAPSRPVLTKVQDDMPAIYGLRSKVSNCLVADGCQLRGTATGSVLFRGVTIEEGAVVTNCVLMQGTYVSANAVLTNVIADKAVFIKPGKTLMGAENYPIYLGKKIVI